MTRFLYEANSEERGIMRASFCADHTSEPTREEVFNFLEYLRDTGVTNMYGAVPYIEHYLDVPKNKAKEHWTAWMNHFQEAAQLRHFILSDD